MTAIPLDERTATATATAAVGTVELPTKAGTRTRARIQPVAAVRKHFGVRDMPDAEEVGLVRRIAGLITPPEVWTERAPSLRDVTYYAWYGEWTGTGTAGRVLGKFYASLVAIPAFVVLYLLTWVIARPARGIAVVVLTTLVALTPPGGVALGAVAGVLRWLANLTA